MSPNFCYPNYLIYVLISSIFISTVSSRPMITTNPKLEDQVATNFLLKSSDGENFDVQLHVALQSDTIKQIISDRGFSNEMVISFPNITGETMAKVLEYCNKHVYYTGPGNNITADDDIKAFDTQFVNVHYETLFKLVLAANELNIKDLLDLVSSKIADMIKGKTPNEIRRLFNINKGSCVDNVAEQEFVQDDAWAFPD